MVGVVEEEHEIAEADEGVGALTGAGEVPAVAVYVTDHVQSHDRKPKSWRAPVGRVPSAGYFPVTETLV
ncbi:hypothetical protein GCM10017688_24460 [Streptomyces ramulosus]